MHVICLCGTHSDPSMFNIHLSCERREAERSPEVNVSDMERCRHEKQKRKDSLACNANEGPLPFSLTHTSRCSTCSFTTSVINFSLSLYNRGSNSLSCWRVCI